MSMNETSQDILPPGVQRVMATLAELGHPHTPVMLDDAARTAQQAADALGVALGQIAKSIIFRRKNHPSGDDAAVLVITSGDLRVDEKKVQAIVCAEGGKTRPGRCGFREGQDRLFDWRCVAAGARHAAGDADRSSSCSASAKSGPRPVTRTACSASRPPTCSSSPARRCTT